MDAKTVFGICVAVIMLVLGGCFGDVAGGGKGNASMQPASNAKACYADARAQLSPQWAGASTLDRAVAAISVISVCEGSNQP